MKIINSVLKVFSKNQLEKTVASELEKKDPEDAEKIIAKNTKKEQSLISFKYLGLFE